MRSKVSELQAFEDGGSTFMNLWSNGLKECLELPHYNFGISIPSFAQREVLSTRKMEEGQH